MMHPYKVLFTLVLLALTGHDVQAKSEKKVVVEVNPATLHPLLAIPGVDYFLMGTAKQMFERSPRPGRQGLPIIISNLVADSVVTVESSSGEKLRTLLFVNGQNELRIADLDAHRKYSLVVKHPEKAQPVKIENVEAGSQIRMHQPQN